MFILILTMINMTSIFIFGKVNKKDGGFYEAKT